MFTLLRMNCVNGQIAKNDIRCTQNNVIDRALDIGKLFLGVTIFLSIYGNVYCNILTYQQLNKLKRVQDYRSPSSFFHFLFYFTMRRRLNIHDFNSTVFLACLNNKDQNNSIEIILAK